MSDAQDFSEVKIDWDELDREFISIRDDVLIDDAAQQRARISSLRQQAESSASLRSFLRDLSQNQSEISLTSISGNTYHGVVEELSDRSLKINTGKAFVWIRMAALSSVRPNPANKSQNHILPLTEKRTNNSTLDLTLVLATLAENRSRVVIHLLGERKPSYGFLRAFGDDVVTLANDENEVVAYINLNSITEIELA